MVRVLQKDETRNCEMRVGMCTSRSFLPFRIAAVTRVEHRLNVCPQCKNDHDIATAPAVTDPTKARGAFPQGGIV
jgi:hypothetical protein